MAVLRALLLGDIATLQFPASSGGHRGDDEVEGRLGLGYMLKRSFGKVGEVHSQHDLEPPASSQQPATATNSGLRFLQLSLEEAFYLAHVDECLALAVRPVFFPGAGATALPSPPRRKRRLGDEHPHPLHHHPGRHQGGADDGGRTARGQAFGTSLGFTASGGNGRADAEVLDGDTAPLLSSEEAWRYCCERRPDFPAMFAVFRHFRARRYTVHTGHKYGAHFVLYEGPPDECHSRYCVHVAGGGSGGGDSWGHMKTVTRLMPDVAKCLLVCGVTYQSSQRQTLPESRSSPPLDTSSLAALEVAEVTALRFSRSREPDGEGGKSATTTLKVRQTATIDRDFVSRNQRREQARRL